MKIVTINIPESFVEAIERLVGEGGLYSSRSELIRCAVKEFLVRELKNCKDETETEPEPDSDEDKFVRVPNYKVVRKLNPPNYKVVRKLNPPRGKGNIWYDDLFDNNGNLIRERYIDQMTGSELEEYNRTFEIVRGTRCE